MGVYGTGIEYGSGEVYGEITYFISPDSGPITGGTEVVIAGTAFLDTSLDDDFNDGAISAALWTVTNVGDASSATESAGKLHLQAGPVAGNSSEIETNNTVTETDVEVDYEIVTDINALPPPGTVELATLRLEVDGSNYTQVSRKSGPTFGDRYEVSVVVAGVTIESASITTSDTSGSLRIIRNGTTVYLYAGETEILRRSGFPTTAATVQVRVDNLSTAYGIQTDFDDFFVHCMVAFGTEPMLDALVGSDDRITGTTPAGLVYTAVDVEFSSATTDLSTFTDGYTYTDPTQFRILADTSLNATVDVSITNDTVLRNLRTGRPGFGR